MRAATRAGRATGRRPGEEAPPLLRGLRVKFVALNMAIAVLVLASSFAAICFMDYRGDVDEVYRTLRQTAARAVEKPPLTPGHTPLLPDEPPMNDEADAEGAETREDGAQPERPDGTAGPNGGGEAPSVSEYGEYGTAGPPDAGMPADAAPGGETAGTTPDDGAGDAADDAGAMFAAPQIGGGRHHGGDNALPVATFYCEAGTAVQLVDQSSASVPESVLMQAIPAALRSSSDHGHLGESGLFFAKRETGAGTIVAFADGGAADGWHGLALGLAGVGVAALGLLFLLNLLFSQWALGPVQRAWSQQQQFMADASHELKTPLTVILANNAILRQRGGETVASQSQWVESTQVEAERMQALVADMLDLARPAGAAPAGQTAPSLDFSRLVEGETLTFESVAFERDITWETAVDAGIHVRGNAARLQRLVAVLLDNACKYTEPAGQVGVALRAEGADALLSVRNSGEPIAPEDLPHLFDRFYRADKARTQAGADAAAPEGYGLGLAIAQDIAQAHKGTLAVTSTATAGTTFTLRIPLA